MLHANVEAEVHLSGNLFRKEAQEELRKTQNKWLFLENPLQ